MVSRRGSRHPQDCAGGVRVLFEQRRGSGLQSGQQNSGGSGAVGISETVPTRVTARVGSADVEIGQRGSPPRHLMGVLLSPGWQSHAL